MTAVTLTLAQILGAYMLIMGAGLLVHRRAMGRIIDRLRADESLTWTIAAFELLAALVLIAVHNDWSNPIAILISLIGWLAAIEAALLILVGRKYFLMLAPVAHGGTAGLVWGGVSVLVGLVLLLAGFTAW